MVVWGVVSRTYLVQVQELLIDELLQRESELHSWHTTPKREHRAAVPLGKDFEL